MLYLFNTNIIPGEAVARVSKATGRTVVELMTDAAADGTMVSAIGHEATAQAFSKITGIEVPVNRIQAAPQPGDRAISLKINGRLPEGQILSLEEMQKIGYEIFLIEFFDVNTPVG